MPTKNEANSEKLAPYMCLAREFSAHVLCIEWKSSRRKSVYRKIKGNIKKFCRSTRPPVRSESKKKKKYPSKYYYDSRETFTTRLMTRIKSVQLVVFARCARARARTNKNSLRIQFYYNTVKVKKKKKNVTIC